MFWWIVWIVCTYGLIKVCRPLALLLCIWIANVEYTWCHSPKLIVLVEILVATVVSMSLPSSILYWLVLIVYFTPVIFCLNAIFVAPFQYTIVTWLAESSHLW